MKIINRKPKILIVDDEAIVARNMQRSLKNLGYHAPEIVLSGKEAVDKASEMHPDLILMDISMPGELDGIDAANKIRSRQDIPIIFVTAHANKDTLARAKISEPFGYILKPVTVRELESNIEMALYKHRSEMELKTSRAYWQALIENSSDIVVIVQEDGEVAYISPSAERIVGFSPAALMQNDIAARVHADDYANLLEIFTNIIHSPQQIHQIMFRFLHQNNEWVSLEGLVRNDIQSPLVGGFVLNIRDVTERAQMQAALVQSNQQLEGTIANLRAAQQQLIERERLAAIGQLAGGIAHEFNNIMAAVILQSDLLMQRITLPNEISQKVSMIRQSGERAANLVQQILDFSRKAMIRPEPVALVPFLQELEPLLNHLLGKKILVNISYEPEPLVTRIDVGRLKQALLNLVFNAQNALQEEGALLIKLNQLHIAPDDPVPVVGMEPGGWVSILVQDDGVGIPPEVMPHIFEPFFTTNAPVHSGLGLSQTLGIVQQHQGHLKIESAVGEGTAVTIYLPLLDIQELNSEQAVKQTNTEFGRILLVESNDHLRHALTDGLMSLGYDLLITDNIEQASTLLEKFGKEILCLICDQNNQGISSERFGQQAMLLYPYLSVILLANHISSDDKVDELGIVWLRKPVSLDLLEKALQRIVSRNVNE